MNMLKFFVLLIPLLFVNVHAAEQSTAQPQQTTTKDPHSAGTYTWQRCVEDHEKEGGHTQAEAYAKCENLK